MTKLRAAVAVACGRTERWREIILESLGADAVAADPGVGSRSVLPAPWSFLLRAQRLFGGKGPRHLSHRAVDARPLDTVRADILVLPPGIVLPPETMERFPLGVLEMEPIHPARMSDGSLEGRMYWRRPGLAPRLAASTFTCMEDPLPGAWTGAHLAKAALMPARFLARIAREGVESVWRDCPEALPLPPFKAGLRHWLGLAADYVSWAIVWLWRDVFYRWQWVLGVRPGDGDPTRPGFADRPFTPIIPPGLTGWADPFLFGRDGRNWLFVEEIPPGQKGVISVLELLPGGGLSPARRVLEEPFHLSYPNVFEHEGEVYMLPETAKSGQVRLYRATDFPGGWVLDRVLLDGVPATDATLVEHGGKWWMFVNLRPEGGSSWDELHLFEGASRLGPFSPHPANPVVTDVRRARPGGRFLRRGGKLYRPAQDCSGWYGRALTVMEVTRLDGQGYQEKPAARLEASLISGSFCLHAFDADGVLEIVDGQRLVPVWR